MASRTADDVAREMTEGYWGDLAWSDCPTAPGWYWILIGPSTVVRGPARVQWQAGVLVGQVFSEGGGFKPVASFGRRWAGPLARPLDPEGLP